MTLEGGFTVVQVRVNTLPGLSPLPRAAAALGKSVHAIHFPQLGAVSFKRRTVKVRFRQFYVCNKQLRCSTIAHAMI